MRLGAFVAAPVWGFAGDVDARIDHGKTATLPDDCRILAATIGLDQVMGWGVLCDTAAARL
jgi:hypothetical protein